MKMQYLGANDKACLELEQKSGSGEAIVVVLGYAQIVEPEDNQTKIFMMAREVTGRLYFNI